MAKKRMYTKEDVERLRGSLKIEYTIAKYGAARLRELLNSRTFVRSLGALTGGQAVQQVKAGLESIYVSGWQIAADNNSSQNTYPDQSLYPVDSAPKLVERINMALQRADQINHKTSDIDWFAPIIADAEAGFGGPLNAFELMKAMIKAGAAGVHFEDQLASAKKCGHLGGKVLVPTALFERTLTAARLAADICDVPTVIIARTDANSAKLLTSDVDERDVRFIDHSKPRTAEGYYHYVGGIEAAIERGLSYAPYADLLWCETSTPDLGEAKEFAEAIHAKYPGKLLAYNCSPSFNWCKNMTEKQRLLFQKNLGDMGYKYQFVTLAGFHQLNYGMFELAREYKKTGMLAYSKLQEKEFFAGELGYTAVKHQQEVGTQYFDDVAKTIVGDEISTLSMTESTEAEQF